MFSAGIRPRVKFVMTDADCEADSISGEVKYSSLGDRERDDRCGREL